MDTPLPIRVLGALLRVTGTVFPRQTARAASSLSFRPFRMPMRPWQAEAAQDAQRRTFEGDLGLTPALVWGAPDAERTFLMVHGWEGRGSQFGRLGQALAAKGHRAIAVDVIGHGEARSGQSTPEAWSDALLSVAREVGPLAGLATHSMGAGPSMHALHGELETERLVHFSPAAHIAPLMRTAARKLGLPERALDHFIEDSVQKIIDAGGDPEFAKMAEALDPSTAPEALVIHAPDDDVVSIEEGRKLAAAHHRGRFEACGDLGHFKLLRDPQVVRVAAEFLHGTTEAGAPEGTPASACSPSQP